MPQERSLGCQSTLLVFLRSSNWTPIWIREIHHFLFVVTGLLDASMNKEISQLRTINWWMQDRRQICVNNKHSKYIFIVILKWLSYCYSHIFCSNCLSNKLLLYHFLSFNYMFKNDSHKTILLMKATQNCYIFLEMYIFILFIRWLEKNW